ncbi:glycosyltransferase [Evansella cellulosilytica]|uniref:Glycosyl transferase group 1 n=1 Tax=Evansella cellulosilytica (strain ATCC 21833 / DSM 2522 / FERM P-1141 / JCM 9156 / N-4) TaxID=649639 RepID=E6U1V9_EVAC2|nr:glycosyltransferase [Evansella cellulosilytica]ADU31606.1 glycosyl transferase group 1 [Evansella cellulosilytica DSM 2522]
MKVLYITEKVPYTPGTADQIRAVQQIEGLVQAGIEVDCLFCHEQHLYKLTSDKVLAKLFNTSTGNVWSTSLNKKRIRQKIMSLFNGTPFRFSAFHIPELKTVIKELIDEANYDLIQIQGRLAHNIIDLQIDIPVLVDYIDVDSTYYKQHIEKTQNKLKLLYYKEQFRRVCNIENSVYSNFKAGMVHSNKDKEQILKKVDYGKIKVIPTYLEETECEEHTSNRKVIVFSCMMNNQAEMEAANRLVKNIFTPLKRNIEDLECWIVGTHLPKKIETLEKIEGVKINNNVKDSHQFYSDAFAYVNPADFGSGYQYAALHAAVHKCPIVTTHVVNESIGLTDEKDAFICETDDQFIKSIIELLENQSLGKRFAQRTERYVKNIYKKDYSMMQLIATYKELVEESDDTVIHPKKDDSEKILN